MVMGSRYLEEALLKRRRKPAERLAVVQMPMALSLLDVEDRLEFKFKKGTSSRANRNRINVLVRDAEKGSVKGREHETEWGNSGELIVRRTK